VIAIQTGDRNGSVVAAVLVEPVDEIMLITDGGVLVRTRVSEVKASSRVTMGVKLIALDQGAQLAGLQKVAESAVEAIDDDSVEPAESADSPDSPDSAPGDLPAPEA
jgi:DNA gyrase subunit A